jgi:glyceraldehyde-3-phosphate dehydrogenase (NADP+)
MPMSDTALSAHKTFVAPKRYTYALAPRGSRHHNSGAVQDPVLAHEAVMWPAVVCGQPRPGPTVEIVNPHTGEPVFRAGQADAAAIADALEGAVSAREVMRRLPLHQRSAILSAAARLIEQQADDLARTISLEVAKPIKQARVEVQRAATTFVIAGEEARRLPGELVNLDALPVGQGHVGIVRCYPVGPVVAITPFNFPINLAAHKLAPAIAAGCPVILKPAPQAPVSALKLARLVLEAGCPPEALSVVPSSNEMAESMVTDERPRMLTFTGSPEVGWMLKSRAGRKRVVLELGGNAGVIVHSDASLDEAVPMIVNGAFGFAGQSCISVQRVLAQRHIYEPLVARLVEAVGRLKVGDPRDETTDLSAVIDSRSASRIREWVAEACAAGARCAVGGQVDGRLVEPTVLLSTTPDMKVNCREIFGPVLTVRAYDDFQDAVRELDASPYGLQAGVFTRDIERILYAHEHIEVGTVLANQVPTWRADHMPYGGVKSSGLGREGVRYAIEAMTEPRLLVLRSAGPLR